MSTTADRPLESTILTIDQAAAYLAIPKATLYTWRTRRAGFGPPAIKIGGCLRYRRSDLDAWIAQHVETFDGPEDAADSTPCSLTVRWARALTSVPWSRALRRLLSRPMTAILRDHAVSGSGGISVGGYREIQTAEGPALVDDYGQPYAPSLDLLAIATGVGELLERDQYRVTTITTGTDIATVWLAAIDRDTAQTTVGRVRGCVSVSAAPASEAASVFPDQMLLAYVAECASPSDATGLATAASQPDSSNVAEIAISYETLCLIVIARSTVKGIEPIETTQSIARFREPLTQVLHGS